MDCTTTPAYVDEPGRGDLLNLNNGSFVEVLEIHDLEGVIIAPPVSTRPVDLDLAVDGRDGLGSLRPCDVCP